MLATEMDRIVQEYRRLRAVVPLGSIRTKKEYERAVSLLDAILDEIGSQGVISELLAGKRELNTRQIRILAKRFGVSPAVFV